MRSNRTTILQERATKIGGLVPKKQTPSKNLRALEIGIYESLVSSIVDKRQQNQ